MNARPLYERVLVKEIEAADKTAGGLMIPNEAKEVPVEGHIVAMGQNVNKQGENLEVGQRILFQRYAGLNVKLNGEKLKLIICNDILMVYED